MQKNSIITVVTVLVILVLAGFGISAYFKGKTTSAPHLDTFVVEKPNLIASGGNLSGVEVWSIPTGTGITENEYKKLGNATLTNTDDAAAPQRFVYQIPLEPMLVTEIFAKGLDKDGNEVGRVSLSTKGASELGTLLWNVAGPKESTLKVNETITSSDGKLTLKALEVTEDSRCPLDVQCIQAGKVTLKVEARVTGEAARTVSISTDKTATIDRYLVSLVKVRPDPNTDVDIKPTDYQFTISIAEDVKG
jgi:hypothetical protein